MKPKHHKRRNKSEEKNIESSMDWHPVAVDTSAISVDEFECFGGIEELTDYELIRSDKKGNIVTINSRSKAISKKRKLRTIKKEHSNRNGLNADSGDVEDLNTRPKKKKKRKHLLSFKEDILTENNILKNESSCTEDFIDLSAWCNCFVPEPILSALKDLKFDKPTPIQELTLPSAIRDYQDILGAAETGSGKTLAFGIPIVAHILASKEKEKNESPQSLDAEDNVCSNFKSYVSDQPLRALILAPTRELAIQVKNHLLAIVKYTDIRVAAVVGGMSTQKQKRILNKGPDIVVATPGRLWELIEEGDPHLNQAPNIRYLVIDEADRMVEKGHFAELTQILDLINGNKTKQRRQTFVFSATLTLVHDLPKRMVLKKRKVKMEQKQKLESLIQLIGMKGKPKVIDITRKTGLVETLTESQITCTVEEKDSYLYYFLLKYPGRTLVFCNSIDCVRRLKNVLDHLNCNPLPLHASMQQRQRLKNLERFAASDTGLLLASDVAARGLDIIGIRHVVHFQVPRTSEIYIHRSGRTARAQNEGFSLMLIEPQESVFYKRICKDKFLPTFPVDHNIFKIVKERVSLARMIDQQDHRVQRQAAQNRWFMKAAKEMDIDIEDEGLLNDLGDDGERAQETRKMKSMKKQLEAMIKRPILPKTMMGRYPTKSGKLVQLPMKGPGKAAMVVKGDGKLKSSVLGTLKKKLKKKEKFL